MRYDEPRLVGASLPITHWFLSFGNRTQNSRVAGARPNHQPMGWRGWDPVLYHRVRLFSLVPLVRESSPRNRHYRCPPKRTLFSH